MRRPSCSCRYIFSIRWKPSKVGGAVVWVAESRENIWNRKKQSVGVDIVFACRPQLSWQYFVQNLKALCDPVSLLQKPFLTRGNDSLALAGFFNTLLWNVSSCANKPSSGFVIFSRVPSLSGVPVSIHVLKREVLRTVKAAFIHKRNSRVPDAFLLSIGWAVQGITFLVN